MRKKMMRLVGTPIAALLLALMPGLRQGLAQVPAKTFEVVSIKAYAPTGPPYEACNPHGDATVLRLVGCTAKNLIGLAFDLKSFQMPVSMPSWASDDRFIVEARLTAPTPRGEQFSMLQAVLADRFHVTSHWVDRNGTVYLLEKGRGEPKLAAASRVDHCGEIGIQRTTIKADCMTMGDLVWTLEQLLRDHPVVDQTGIDKDRRFRLTVEYSTTDDPADGPSLFTALPEQVGLSLKAGDGPVRVLVVDHIEKPQAN